MNKTLHLCCLFIILNCTVFKAIGQSCNNWLSLPGNSYAQSAEIDVTGTKITVEATFNRTASYSGGPAWAGDLVSKHRDPTDANYLLRPNNAEITTSNGYFSTPPICEIELNKTYHVAMTYDGSTLKFYRNGFLMSQVTASGTLYQNNWKTRIGFYEAMIHPESFIGFINEVRIWNIVRTQNEIKTYMNASLPSPTTQTGLLAYYTFNNLNNKQGNSAFDLSLETNAKINQTNTSCSFFADSCASKIANVINDYTPVINLDPCYNLLEVSDASAFNVGDTVLLIQMKGAYIDSSDSPSFGTVTNYNNAGNYEFNYIDSKTGNILKFKNKLLKKYDVPTGKVQLVRAPYYENATINSTLTCLPWNGTIGGVLTFNVQNDLILNADINVDGKGFRKGAPLNSSAVTCNETSYYYDAASNKGAQKGEGIHIISDEKNYGRGAPSNGGGGGNGHNCGGGGGANGGSGGHGGDQWQGCDNITENVGGVGGMALQNSAVLNKLYMGGSGGMGQGNDMNEFPSGSGGGIIIISAASIKNNSKIISANGENASPCPGGPCGDGMSGGGAGGSILLDIATLNDQAFIQTKGGDGANHVSANSYKHGPGGGGGGGFIAIKQTTASSFYTFNTSGGANGINTNHGNDPYGATAGNAGMIINSFDVATSSTPFKFNIDSVRIKDSAIRCNYIDFKGLDYINFDPIVKWNWLFGDNETASIQNTTHLYSTAGDFPVKLIVIDINGCQDSTAIQVITLIPPAISITDDTLVCFNTSLQLEASGGVSYSWSPVTGLSNPFSHNPIATITENTKYKLSVKGINDCVSEDSVMVSVRPYPLFSASSGSTICQGTEIKLNAAGGDNYLWNPSSLVTNPVIPQPTTQPDITTDYSVYISENACGFDTTINMHIIVNPVPAISVQKSNDINCNVPTAQLNATGALYYNWSPAAGVDNPFIPNPEAAIDSTTIFVVTGTNEYGCSSSQPITVIADNKAGVPRFVVPNAFTPNGDGKNDCFGIRRWGNASIAQFSVYNRWGQIVFQTKDPRKCWDGTFNGKQQDAGGYIYVIKATTICGAITRKGMLTLIR